MTFRETSPPFDLMDLGRMAYAPAMEVQRRAHRRVLAGAAAPTLILVEHEPVITLSKRRCAATNLRAPQEVLARLGIEVHQTDRGGDITYHGPGQVVLYPIVELASYRLNIGRYMRWLEQIVIDAVAAFGVQTFREPKLAGVWAHDPQHGPATAAKLCAVGVRVERGVTLHGAALNVNTCLEHFQTIVPCGLADRPVTSLERLLGASAPAFEAVKRRVVESFGHGLANLVATPGPMPASF
jgi:lipoyl(octanoyl) transferase